MGFAFWFPLYSSHLHPNSYLLFLCQHSFLFSSFLLFDPSYLLSHSSHWPSFLYSHCTGVWLRSVHGGGCMNSSCSLCKGVPPLPPSNLSLIVTCISNSEPRLLNGELLFYAWLFEPESTWTWRFAVVYFSHTTTEKFIAAASPCFLSNVRDPTLCADMM